jgi:hypothetical protein
VDTDTEDTDMNQAGSASVGNGNASLGDFPMDVAAYMHRVQERLVAESDDGWVLSVETHVTYSFDAQQTTVNREGGTFLLSKAHGRIAELTIEQTTNDNEVIVRVEPIAAMPWRVAKILMLR